MDRGKKPSSKKVRKSGTEEAEAKDDGEYDIWDELLAGTARSTGVPKTREKTARFRPNSSLCEEHKCDCGAIPDMGPTLAQPPAPLRASHPQEHPPAPAGAPMSYEDLAAALQNDPQYARLREDFTRLVCLRVAELDSSQATPPPYPSAAHLATSPATVPHPMSGARRPPTPATPIISRPTSDPQALPTNAVQPPPSHSPARATPVAIPLAGGPPLTASHLGCPSPASGRSVLTAAGAPSPPPTSGTPRPLRASNGVPTSVETTSQPSRSQMPPQPNAQSQAAGVNASQPPPPPSQSPSVEALLLPLVDKFLQENLGSLHQMQKTPTPWMRPAGCATIDDEMKWLASQNLTERPAPERPGCPIPSSTDFRSPTSPSYNTAVFPYLLPLQSLQPYLQPQQYSAGQPAGHSISHVPYTAVFAPVPIPASELGASLGQYYAHAPQQQQQQQPAQRSRSMSQHASSCPHTSCKICGPRRHRHHSCRCYPSEPTPATQDKRPKKPRQGPDRSKARPHLKSRCSAFSEAGSTSSSQRGKTDFDSVSPRSSCTSGSLFSRSQSESQPSMSDCTTEATEGI